MQERLQKYLARCGLGSRRKCEQLIQDGRATVNGETARLGQCVLAGQDRVEVDSCPVEPSFRRTYWMLNKPPGYVTTVRDPQGRPTVMQLLPPGLPRMFPVGRLDRDSEGLLLFSNDGELTQRLLHPSGKVWKSYHCGLANAPSALTLERLREGLQLEDGPTAPCRAQWKGRFLEIQIREGRKRQIRRMLAHLGHPVLWLRRVALGPLQLGDLPPGQARPLTRAEIEAFRV